ncbi:Hsp33 family molecular chaperone HslO [Eubacteriales bacterium OttesenSCG-928-K08]|nr:Hsp33 family molecular chaperone HslO [Eubacteriales bacterium OttesenSCG-928-K08]
MTQNNIIVQALLHNSIRIIAISARDMVEEARNIHGLSRVLTAGLGRQLMATAMMSTQLKHEGESLTTIIKGGGPAGNMVCTGRFGGLVKGYVFNPTVELPLNAKGKLDVSGAVGKNGKITVIRDLSLKEPYVGECNLVSGEIAEDFAQYFTASEQTPSLVYLGVRLNPTSCKTLAGGGIIAQPLPDCPDEYIDELQFRAQEITSLTLRLEEGETLHEALFNIFEGMELSIVGETAPLFQCDCSRERTERALIALGNDELTEMIEEDEGAELTCQFCNKAYSFNKEDLLALLNEAKGVPNVE